MACPSVTVPLLLVAGQGVGVGCCFLLPAGHLVVANNRAVPTLGLAHQRHFSVLGGAELDLILSLPFWAL